MTKKDIDINQIKTLYYKDLFSAREVAERLGIHMTTVYRKMKAEHLKRRSAKETNNIVYQRKPKTFCPQLPKNKEELAFKMLGLALYWAEGAKIGTTSKNYTVDFANSDPEMIRVFSKFLVKFYRVDKKKIRIYLYCHDEWKVKKFIKYWSGITKVPENQFTKPYIRKKIKKTKRSMEHGMIHVRYADGKLLNLINKEINEMQCKYGRFA
ncbi:hypothetical protein D4R86_03605 [bacterium]|nr:MAG: hypothetical protein D4R86_03605 [bacterium]